MPDLKLLLKAYRLMLASQNMAALYDQNRAVCKYVHSTSLGHQAIQLATAFLLTPADWVSPYYRDESLLLGLGFKPYDLMLQLLAKANDPFSGGRSYYGHPSSNHPNKPCIIHQSSATGMQAIPTTGIAQGIQYFETLDRLNGIEKTGSKPMVICSLGDASLTEGEVSEAFQMAALKKLPIVFLVQNNEWGISVTSAEARSMDAMHFASGFKGLNATEVDGSDFEASYITMSDVIDSVRAGNGPWLVQANVPLLGHHTSGVRREFYRQANELEEQQRRNPIPRLKKRLMELGVLDQQLDELALTVANEVNADFALAQQAPEPQVANVADHVFASTSILEEKGQRQPLGAETVLMVDAALFAIREIMEDNPEALLYGQDVGRRLGGVFREAATLAEQFGDHRVFNTAIQEAYIIGSTAGISAVGAKPIVEVQFADYIWPGLNQLVCEISKSCYLTLGKYPVRALIRVPIGAYGGGGPYHSGSIESILLNIKGIKVVYPSNAADMKGLLKAAFYDPNPVVMLEHKGLYWSKLPGTEGAKCPEPDRDYIIPLGKGRRVLAAGNKPLEAGETCCIITYGMGVYRALTAAKNWADRVEVIDLRTLYPLDEELVFETVKKHGKCLVLTEEAQNNSFAEALAGRISQACFRWLDAPVTVLGSLNLPAVPINLTSEEAMLPNALKLEAAISGLMSY